MYVQGTHVHSLYVYMDIHQDTYPVLLSSLPLDLIPVSLLEPWCFLAAARPGHGGRRDHRTPACCRRLRRKPVSKTSRCLQTSTCRVPSTAEGAGGVTGRSANCFGSEVALTVWRFAAKATGVYCTDSSVLA